jgi:hypothetical protein
MGDEIKVVLGVGAVGQVPRGVVELIPVEVPDTLSILPRSMEDQGNKLVDLEFPSSTISIQNDVWIPLVVQPRLQNFSATALSIGEYFSNRVDAVVTEARNTDPLMAFSCVVCHINDYTELKWVVNYAS